jgi:hypothetical protein
MGNLITMCVSDENDSSAGASKPVEQVQNTLKGTFVEHSLLFNHACASQSTYSADLGRQLQILRAFACALGQK